MNVKLLALVAALFVCSEGSKLNLPRVLLPIFKSFSTNYTLEVTGFGCYKWSSSRVDVVEVTPVEVNTAKDCSQKAIVSSVGRVSSRSMAIVLAEEVSTGQVFRTDVIVDLIASLNIVTTTRELYMEEPPEMFEVRAYDSEGNEFTTLEGVELEWRLVKERSGQEVIRFMSFRESTYETPHSIATFDSVGKQGHLVLLDSIRTGTSKVSVRLPHLEYTSVPSVEVTISVLANLIIDPSIVYIMPGDNINFRILQFRQGRLIEIKKTLNPQYVLTPEDNTIVQIEEQTGTGLNLGSCKVLLRDMNSNSGGEQQKLPQALVTVVEPSYISLSILPHNNWALFTNQPAILVTEVYDSDNHKVYLGDNSRIEMKVDESIFQVGLKSRNGSWANGRTVSPGVSEVKSLLFDAGSTSTSRPLLKTSATLHVFPPLTLLPELVAFPFHHITWNEVEMRVEGGDGINTWSIHNQSVAMVTQAGILKPVGEGETRVDVAMVRNEHLKASSTVLVLKPYLLEILGGAHETPVGSYIHMDIMLYGQSSHGVRVPFTDCSQMSFSVNVDPSFEYDRSVKREPVNKDACAVISLLAKQESKAKVVVGLFSGLIEGESTVAAFKPLTPLHPPVSKPVVLAVRSSRHIVFTGGPKPWFGKVTSSYSSNPSVVRASLLYESQELYVYNVVCLKIGTAEFTLTASTEPYTESIQSVESQSKITVVCSKPKHLELSADMGPDCPVSDMDRVLAAKNSRVKVKIVVRDGEGRKFDNATSLMYKWFWGKDNLFGVEEPELINLNREIHSEFVLPLDHFKELSTKNTAETSLVKLKAVGYLHDRLSTEIRAEGTITVSIVDGLTAEPSSLSIINQAGAQSMVRLLHGSGYFGVEPLQDNVVSVDFDEALKRIVWIKPTMDGRTTLKMVDKCVQSSFVEVPVQVVNVGAVRIEVASRMQVNRQVTAVVKLYDTLDRELSGDIGDILLETTAGGVVTVARSDPNNPRIFLVKAQEVGRTSLVASFNNLSSPPAQIQVFTAIKLYPRNITLIVGSEYQVRVTGGPGPDLQFTLSDNSVASISNTGLISALHIGETWVTVSTLGGEGRDGIAVTVVPMTGVQIGGPTNVLCVSGRSPLWVQPLPETLSPLVLGSVHPAFTYTWTSSHPGVAHISDRYAQVNIHVREEDRLSVEVRGGKAGRTVIQLRVVGGSTHHGVYESSLELTVVDELEFTSPPASIPTVLVHPYTTFHVLTNLEKAKLSVMSVVSEGGSQTDEDRGLSVAQSPVVSLNGDNTAKSHGLGQALVTASLTHPRPNRQMAALFIQVRSVQFMMVNVVNVVNGSSLSALPRGLDLLLNVTYHDSLGRVFYAAPSKLALRTNRHDKILKRGGMSNSSFVMGLEGEGITVLHASDSISPLAHDYLRIPVDNHILPTRRHMTVGEVLCFESVAGVRGTSSGAWSSEGDAIIIEHDGLAHAVKPGTSVITFKQPNHLANIQTSVNIQVHPLHALLFGPSLALSNAEVGKEYIVGVSLQSQNPARTRDAYVHTHPCTSNHVVSSYPFTCQMRFNSLSVPHPIAAIFTVMPTFDKATGGFGCLVRVVGGISPNTSVILSNVTLRVTTSVDNSQDSSMVTSNANVMQDSVVLEFHPAVYLATPQLSLSTPASIAHLVIVATPHVAQHIIVEAGDRTALRVGEVEKRGSVSWSWPVQLYRDHWSTIHRLNDLNLVVLSPLTNQTIKVAVLTPGGTGVYKGCVYPDTSPWTMSDLVPSATTSIFIAIMAIIIFFMASNYCYNQWNRSQVCSPPNRFSPSHPTHASLQEFSLGGRTPSPMSHRSVVYGTPDHSPTEHTLSGSGGTRLRKLYQ